MSPDRLLQYSRKELESLARSQGVPNIRQLRKQDLIDALVTPRTSPSAHRGAAAAKALSSPASKSRLGRPEVRRQRSIESSPEFVDPRQQCDELHVEVVDSPWVRISWKISPMTRERAIAALGPEWHTARMVLQLIDVTPTEQGDLSNHQTETVLATGSAVWYTRLSDTDRTYRVALGYRSPSGRFHLVLRSRPLVPSQVRRHSVETTRQGAPVAAPSQLEEPQTVAGEREDGGDSPVVASSRLPVQRPYLAPEAAGPPPLGVDLELTIHGRSTPFGDVKVHSKPVQVGSDGRFVHRVRVAAGRAVIPVVATAPDRSSERTIVVALDLSARELEPREFGET